MKYWGRPWFKFKTAITVSFQWVLAKRKGGGCCVKTIVSFRWNLMPYYPVSTCNIHLMFLFLKKIRLKNICQPFRSYECCAILFLSSKRFQGSWLLLKKKTLSIVLNVIAIWQVISVREILDRFKDKFFFCIYFQFAGTW